VTREATGFEHRGFDRDRGKLAKPHKTRDLEKRRSNTEKYTTHLIEIVRLLVALNVFSEICF